MGKKMNIPNGAVLITGFPLDGDDNVVFLSSDNISDIKTVLAYGYEDGKPWHDNTCVMEIIFHNVQDNIGADRIRILYEWPSSLLAQFSQIMLNLPVEKDSFSNSFSPSFPVSVKMDLNCNYGFENDEKKGIKVKDFDEFNCSIRHKQRFFVSNPIEPDD